MLPRTVFLVLAVFALALPTFAQAPSGPDATPPTPAAIAEQIRAAQAKFDAKLYAEAAEAIRGILSEDKNNIDGNLLAGKVLMATNNYNEARENFKKVIELEPSNFEANLNLGKIWIASRYWRQAISFLQEAEKVAPESGRAEVKRLLAQALAASGQTPKGLDKAQEAIQVNPDDLDAQQILVEIRQSAATQDPQQLEPLLADADKFVQKAMQAVERKPWDRETLALLNKAYEYKSDALIAKNNSFYQRDVHRAAVDRLLPGKGPDAAAVLVRIAENKRAQALLKLVLAEHDAMELTERSVQDDYDARNIKFLTALVAAYEQLQTLTARMAGPNVMNDATLHDRATDVCRKIIELDPANEIARQYLGAGSATTTSQPAAPEP